MTDLVVVGTGWCPPATGGLDRYVTGYVEALREAGHDCVAVVLSQPSDLPGHVVAAARPDEPVLARLRNVDREVRRLDPDVLDVHFALYGLLSVLRRRRVPLLVHFHGPWADETVAGGRRANRAMLAVERAVYRRADRVVTLSGAFRSLVIERYGVAPERCVVIPGAVELDRFTPADDRDALRQRLGVDGSFVVLTARRLIRRTGVDLLISAWSTVAAAVPGAVLVVAGDGPEADDLRARAAASPAADRIRFVGLVPDAELIDWYRAADVSVVPSRALEGFGLVVLESLATGTPVVVTDIGGMPEAIAAFDPTAIVPATAAALADRLVAAARPGGLPDREGCRAHAERFGWDRARTSTEQLLTELTGGAAGGRPAPVRVAFVDHCARMSGAELSLLRTIAALDDGVEAYVVLGEDGPLVGALRDAGATVEVLPMPGTLGTTTRAEAGSAAKSIGSMLSMAGYIRSLRRTLRRIDPDVVQTVSLKAALYGGVAGRAARTKVVWNIQDRIADDYLSGKLVRVVQALGRRLPHAIIANSDATMDTLGPAPADQVRVVIPPLSSFEAPTDGAAARRAPGAEPVIGIIGRLSPWKGQDVFLRAFAEAFPDGGARGRVIGGALFGEDDVEVSLRALVEELGLTDRVELLGHRDDVADQLAALDVVVHASTIPEPFGQVVVEAMAAGVPIVAAAAGGPLDVITDGVDGLLTSPGDVAALAAALARLAADPAERARLAEAGRRRADDFRPEALAARFAAVHRRLARGGSR